MTAIIPQENRIAIITPLPSEATLMEALIIKVDSVFSGDTTKYQLILIDDSDDDASSAILKKYDEKFPVSIVCSAKLKRIKAGIAIYASTLIDKDVTILPKLAEKSLRSRKKIVAAVDKKSGFEKITSQVTRLFITDPRKQRIHIFNTSEYIAFKVKDVKNPDVTFQTLAASPALALLNESNFSSIQYINISTFEKPAKSPSTSKLTLSNKKFKDFTELELEQRGSGFYYKGTEYVTHNNLERKNTAVVRTSLNQRTIMLLGLLLILVLAPMLGHVLLVAIVSIVTFLYALDLLFSMLLIYRGYTNYSEVKITSDISEVKRDWPSYTILCPLYKEVAVVPQFISAMRAVEYPHDKLEVILLLEEDDTETVAAISSMNLPAFFKITVVPHSMPKTKPKACNYGLLQAKGEYTVIYDAEDIPDPLQLKKAVLTFENSPKNTACIQAKLNYYNWNQNLLTRLFTLEYSLWFNLVLTGLQSIKAPIPLGGTSNHFPVALLRQLGGWDPFNVTEDADLGIRIAKRGLKTAILDSTTLEEANSAYGNWLKQRSRWIKGYMQTYLVHMRDLREFNRNSSFLDMFTFQLTIGGKIVSMLVNPLLWAMTITYFALRPIAGDFIETLYLDPVFYVGAISLIVGNFLYVYYYMMGAARQNRPELIVYCLFVPIYWLMMSMAAVMALRDLIIRPFHWHKTKHGLHLKPTGKAAA